MPFDDYTYYTLTGEKLALAEKYFETLKQKDADRKVFEAKYGATGSIGVRGRITGLIRDTKPDGAWRQAKEQNDWWVPDGKQRKAANELHVELAKLSYPNCPFGLDDVIGRYFVCPFLTKVGEQIIFAQAKTKPALPDTTPMKLWEYIKLVEDYNDSLPKKEKTDVDENGEDVSDSGSHGSSNSDRDTTG